jgi:succinylarginine dihydrolase
MIVTLLGLDEGVIFGMHNAVGNVDHLNGPSLSPLYRIGANPGALDGIEKGVYGGSDHNGQGGSVYPRRLAWTASKGLPG